MALDVAFASICSEMDCREFRGNEICLRWLFIRQPDIGLVRSVTLKVVVEIQTNGHFGEDRLQPRHPRRQPQCSDTLGARDCELSRLHKNVLTTLRKIPLCGVAHRLANAQKLLSVLG